MGQTLLEKYFYKEKFIKIDRNFMIVGWSGRLNIVNILNSNLKIIRILFDDIYKIILLKKRN